MCVPDRFVDRSTGRVPRKPQVGHPREYRSRVRVETRMIEEEADDKYQGCEKGRCSHDCGTSMRQNFENCVHDGGVRCEMRATGA